MSSSRELFGNVREPSSVEISLQPDRSPGGLAAGMDGRETHGHSPDKLSGLQWTAIALGAIALAFLIYGSLTSHGGGHHGSDGAHAPSLWSLIPFAGLLLSIAILPLVPATAHWWEHNQNRLMISLGFAAATLI